MSLYDRFLARMGLQRTFLPFTPAELMAMQNSLGVSYYPSQTYPKSTEVIGQGFASFVANAYASNPIVFAVENARVQLFSEARFQFQVMKDGRPGELTQGPSTYLRLLENPWPGGTTSQLLKDLLLDADLGGNAFVLRRPTMLQRLRPDWTVIIAGNPNSNATTWDIDTQVLGYGYQPDGPNGGKEWEYFQRSEVAHFKSTHDPLRRFSGLPWLMSAIRDLAGDGAATTHKLRYFENAATPNAVVTFDASMDLQKAQQWIELFKKDHEGAANAYKTLFLGGGTTMTPIGDTLRSAAFVDVQSGGELRIASAGGVPPIMVGIKGGLDAATYSNYGSARRAFADLTMRPLWRDAAGAFSTIFQKPENSRLWYDDRDISFLQEDVKDAADIQSVQAGAIRSLVDAGFKPESVIEAVTSGDFARLQHTDLYSVQLQPPGTTSSLPEPEQPKQLPPGEGVRCGSCDKLVARRLGPGSELECSRCKTVLAVA
jgi:phage portal protein BeeE